MPRTHISLNHHWKYAPTFQEAHLSPNYDDSGWKTVNLPHANIETPYNCFDEKMFQFVSCYRHTIKLDSSYRGKRVFLDFEGVMTAADVYLNGEFIGGHKGGYTPFRVELTDNLIFEKPNALAVKVDSTERPDIPPFGGSIDYLTFGGMYREASLFIADPVYMTNVFVRPKDALNESKTVDYTLFLRNTLPTAQTLRAVVKLKEGDAVLAAASEQIKIEANSAQRFDFSIANVRNVRLWELDDPALYTFDVTVTSDDGAIEDVYQTRIGFRAAEFTPNGFRLNGRPVKLRGLNRHQTFPYVGQAMPARAQRKDADILKEELHLNLVRTSHYPQSRHFLDRCDEIGLLVLEEIPGWQHIGDQAWKQVACANVREMIERDWNHPSIILWGVRINESQDDHDFYAETNRIAHELDATRQTGGIRYITQSELLEDVYTMNDFAHNGGEIALRDQREVTGLDWLVPYLITEFNGHMYPTKRFDQEERLVEHALRHARVQSRAGADDTICGGIGWCAFDYNTHYNFGSGDRICYHGVMDMFRLPKMAAHFYRSQGDPRQDAVLEPATLWTRGERSIGGVIPLVIFTNCDAVDFYYGKTLVNRFFPAKEQFPGLEHPPVIIEIPPDALGAWGLTWEDGRFVGYLSGNAIIERTFAKDPVPKAIVAVADDAALQADGIDATRIVYRAVDQVGNLTPFLHEFLKLSVSGPGEIIGPHDIPIIGGTAAVWVKAGTQPGVLTLSATCARFAANDVRIETM